MRNLHAPYVFLLALVFGGCSLFLAAFERSLIRARILFDKPVTGQVVAIWGILIWGFWICLLENCVTPGLNKFFPVTLPILSVRLIVTLILRPIRTTFTPYHSSATSSLFQHPPLLRKVAVKVNRAAITAPPRRPYSHRTAVAVSHRTVFVVPLLRDVKSFSASPTPPRSLS